MNQWKKHGHQNVRVKGLNTLEDALETSGGSDRELSQGAQAGKYKAKA